MKRVLLVEPEPGERSAHRLALERAYAVDEAPDAAAATALLSAAPYERAIIDVDLPDGRGIDLLAWMRERGLRFPVLLVASATDRQLAERAHALGAPVVCRPVWEGTIRLLVRAEPPRSVAGHARSFASVHEFSPRETDVLVAVARGTRPAQLPDVLGVEPSTAKTLVRRLLQKTTARNMDEILSLLLRSAARASDT